MEQPELWGKINEAFKDENGNVNAKERDDYLKELIGDDGLSSWDMDQLEWRFGEHGEDNTVISNSGEFKDHMEDKDFLYTTGGRHVKEMLEKYKNDPYVLDQLFTRFDTNHDGKLSNKEAAGLDQYIRGRVTWDSIKAAGTKHEEVDYDRLKGAGARPKLDAVNELINDPTVIDRMPAHSFDGDNIGGGNSRDAYMDDVGGYLDVA